MELRILLRVDYGRLWQEGELERALGQKLVGKGFNMGDIHHTIRVWYILVIVCWVVIEFRYGKEGGLGKGKVQDVTFRGMPW